MSPFDKLATTLRNAYPIVKEGTNWVGILVKDLRVGIGEVPAPMRGIEVVTPVFDVSVLAPEAAMAFTRQHTMCAIVIDNGMYLMREVIDAEDVTPARVQRAIDRVIASATALRLAVARPGRVAN